MKDHIQELADKAKKSVPHGLTPDKWIEVYNEKFAELIVRECAEVADNADATRQKWEGIGKYVREHFGVEE